MSPFSVKRLGSSALIALALMALCLAQPAEAGILRKLYTSVKKVVMLPVYVSYGVGGALVTWFYVGGHEDEIH